MNNPADGVLLAVNGTLMRGLELNNDRHPAMLRVKSGGVAIAVEVWSVPAAGLASILLAEPAGLCIGKVTLADGQEVLGVLGEPILCEEGKEITRHGGWRAYIYAGETPSSSDPSAASGSE